MDQSGRLNAFNTLFMICLNTPPDEVERAIMARAVRTTLGFKVEEVESVRNDIIAMLKTEYPTYKDVKGALEDLQRLRDQEKKAVNTVQAMLKLLADFEFNVEGWKTTPTPLVIPPESDTAPPTP